MTDHLERARQNLVRKQQAQMAEARRRLMASPQAAALRQVLASEAGRGLLTWLEESFLFGDLVGETDAETYFNLGQREVVMNLRRLRDAQIERTGDE